MSPSPNEVTVDDIVALVPEHLAAQRWYDADTPPDEVRVLDAERWLDGDPSLWWLLVEAFDGGRSRGRFQLVIGGRSDPASHDFLHGKDSELLGAVDLGGDDVDDRDGSDDTTTIALYDATIDAPLALALLDRVAPGVEATSVRALTVEQSNSSIVYDEHVIVKLFRRIHVGPNPDVDAISRLVAVGFTHVPDQQGVLARPSPGAADDDHDQVQHLAVARTFLSGASDGWHLALASLRVLFHDHGGASVSGGDFGPDARRLGVITAQMHLGLAEAFGTSSADASGWVAHFRAQLDRVRDHVPAEAISARYDRVAQLGARVGPGIRIHGDLHLGQTLRADSGWFVIDFEGEPARPLAERLAPSSPLRDVAGMLRSFHYTAEVARWEQGAEAAAEALASATDWEERARREFLDGYRTTEGIDELLPDDDTTELLLSGFELDKAVYEVAYEIGFRPTWAGIPLGAIDRILA